MAVTTGTHELGARTPPPATSAPMAGPREPTVGQREPRTVTMGIPRRWRRCLGVREFLTNEVTEVKCRTGQPSTATCDFKHRSVSVRTETAEGHGRGDYGHVRCYSKPQISGDSERLKAACKVMQDRKRSHRPRFQVRHAKFTGQPTPLWRGLPGLQLQGPSPPHDDERVGHVGLGDVLHLKGEDRGQHIPTGHEPGPKLGSPHRTWRSSLRRGLQGECPAQGHDGGTALGEWVRGGGGLPHPGTPRPSHPQICLAPGEINHQPSDMLCISPPRPPRFVSCRDMEVGGTGV